MNLEPLFDAYDLDYDDHTIIRRELLPQGKSRAFVNDTPVTLAQLQAIAPHLVDIHSQHETLSLFSEKFQLEVIDTLADNKDLLEKYSSNYKEFIKLKSELVKLQEAHEAAVKELDYQNFLYQELVDANLDGVDLVSLEEQYETLSNLEQIQESFGEVLMQFDAEEIGIIPALKESRRILGKFQNLSPEFKSIWERTNSVIIELEDLQNNITDALDTQDADPKTLFELDRRLQELYQLQQKHNAATTEELIEIRNDLEEKVVSSSN